MNLTHLKTDCHNCHSVIISSMQWPWNTTKIERNTVKACKKNTIRVLSGETTDQLQKWQANSKAKSEHVSAFYMNNVNKKHITLSFFLPHNIDESSTSFKFSVYSAVFCLFTLCFIQHPMWFLCFCSILLLAGVFLCHRKFDLTGPP